MMILLGVIVVKAGKINIKDPYSGGLSRTDSIAFSFKINIMQ